MDEHDDPRFPPEPSDESSNRNSLWSWLQSALLGLVAVVLTALLLVALTWLWTRFVLGQ